MARSLRIEYAGALYHITSRGNGKQAIFFENSDYHAFLSLLEKTITRYHWQCHAYCLMTNHYHLLIETPRPNLSQGMRHLNGVYSQGINRKYNRVGHLLQGRYGAIIVEKEHYLLELSRYIVLNPVRARMVNAAKDWPWSSYRSTAQLSKPPDWLTTEWLLSCFSVKRDDAVAAYRVFVSGGRGVSTPLNELKNQIYLGSDKFVEEVQRKLAPSKSLNDIPKSQIGKVKKPLSFYEKEVDSRKEKMAIAYQSGCYTLEEIGAHFGVSNATVSRAVKLYECKM